MQTTETLLDGLTIGDTTHREAVLRDPTAADIIDATEAAEKPVQLADGTYAMAVSHARLGLEVMRRCVVRIGDHPGPLTMAELKKLSGRDLSLLQAAHGRAQDAADQALVTELGKRGRREGGGG